MRFDIPKLIRPLELEEYAEELKDITVQVWINPTRELLDESTEIQGELAGFLQRIKAALENDKLSDEKKQEAIDVENESMKGSLAHEMEWWSKILSQSSDESKHLSLEDIRTLDEQDTALWEWIRKSAAGMIRSHREREGKG
jgi:hypothetical protein